MLEYYSLGVSHSINLEITPLIEESLSERDFYQVKDCQQCFVLKMRKTN